MASRFEFEKLQQAYPALELRSGAKELEFNHLYIDSRKIRNDDGFVACVGLQLDGRHYIANAIENGAKLIIAEANELPDDVVEHCQQNKTTLVTLPDLNQQLSTLMRDIYGNSEAALNVVGVTGTNGKSSSVQMIAQALHLVDGCCWTFGTLGVGPYGTQKPNVNTTADPVTIQRELHRAQRSGCGNVAMEVSSHGLAQGRVKGIQFDYAIFTNLTRDHLDYHETMEAYGAAKRELFLMPGLKNAIINVDDKFGRKLKKDQEIKAAKWFYSLQEPTEGADLSQWIWVDDIRLTLQGINATVFTPWGSGKLAVPLVGRFNLYNLLAVIAVIGIKYQDRQKIFEVVNQLTSVTGRMQLIHAAGKPLVIVDYAHSPDALEQVLKATREHCSGKIFTVFGCGGDRDPGKRPLMARVAEKYSNTVVMTDDNPRTESPEAIVDDMRQGLKQPNNVRYVSDREEAIRLAVKEASDKDVVLVAGKGHEDYQIIGERRIELCDIKVAQTILAESAA